MFDYITNRDGKKLFAVIDYPDKKGPFSAVFIVHGFRGSSPQRHIKTLSDSLVNRGFLTLIPDLTKNPGNSYVDFADMTFGQELRDCEDLLDYLLKLEEVDQDKIGITGHSLGGMVAAQVASKKQEVKALCTLSAVYDFEWIANKVFQKPFERAIKDFKQKGFTSVWSSYLEKRLKIKKGFYEDAFGRTAANFAKDIKCPTLIVSSGNDESVNQIHADKYLKTIGSYDKKMEIIEGSDHNYSGENLDKMTSIVASWFAKKLA